MQKLLRSILDRDSIMTQSDIPATDQRVSVSAGACFDVYGYYIDAQKIRQLHYTEVNGQPLLEKTHGAHTFINTRPLMFKGVELPKGALFVQADDGNYAFLRLTPFVFDEYNDMVSAFGTEVLEADDNRESYTQILRRMNIANSF